MIGQLHITLCRERGFGLPAQPQQAASRTVPEGRWEVVIRLALCHAGASFGAIPSDTV